MVTDPRSPLAYGYEGSQIPIYFSQAPVLSVGGGAGFAGFGGGGGAPNLGLGQITTPMANRLKLSPYEKAVEQPVPASPAPAAAPGGGGGGGGGQFGGQAAAGPRPRVVLAFASNPEDMLLSGTLVGGQALAGRAQLVDAAVGRGDVEMIDIRPLS